MSELDALYQEVILDHAKRPRNCHTMEGADRRAEGYNPLCGDRFTLYLKLENDRIADISFQGTGCAISTASASLLVRDIRTLGAGRARMARRRSRCSACRFRSAARDHARSFRRRRRANRLRCARRHSTRSHKH